MEVLYASKNKKNEKLCKGAKLPKGSSSSNEDIEMSPPAKSMDDKLRTWMDTRIQERLEAFNENVQSEPPMVQKDDTTQLLLQILNDQNGRMKKLEQVVSNTDSLRISLHWSKEYLKETQQEG